MDLTLGRLPRQVRAWRLSRRTGGSGTCDDGDQVEAAVAASHPDVVVMDVRMKRMDGAEATRRLRTHDGSPPVLVLTTFDEDEVLSAALRAGASGFQLKDAPGAELLKAVRTVAEGGSCPALRSPDPSLTPRELEVLRLAGRGLANSEIAGQLYISEVTVKAHLGHVLTKLGLRDRRPPSSTRSTPAWPAPGADRHVSW
jgi:DNA-binding NarL/FixJ family response regulator